MQVDLAALQAGEADPNGRTEQDLTAEIEELDSILQEMSEDVQEEVDILHSDWWLIDSLVYRVPQLPKWRLRSRWQHHRLVSVQLGLIFQAHQLLGVR